ncbi:hypothetical protein ABZV24_34675 [Streptomyces sp. NPDC005251]
MSAVQVPRQHEEDRVVARPSQYPLELRRRAVPMVAEVRPEYDT